VNVFALFSLLSCVVVAFQGSFVLHRNPRNVLHRIFFLLCLSAAYLAFAEFQFRQAESLATAYFWLKAGALWGFVLTLELHFVLLFTERTKLFENRLTYLVLYAPALMFFLLELTNVVEAQLVKVYWGWTYTMTEDGIMYSLYDIWFVAMVVLPLYLLLRYYLETTERRKKRQTQYVLIGLSIPTITALLTEPAILFSLLEIRTPDLTTMGFVFECIIVGYAIWKYELFTLTPASAVESIVTTMADALLLVSPEQKVVTVNQAALELLGYEESELIGRSVETILAEEEKTRFRETWLAQLLTADSISDIETTFQTKDVKKIPISLSGSVMRDRDGTERGIVYVGRDLTERKRAEAKLAYMATHDALTGLPNRWLFNDRLTLELARTHRYQQKLAVMLLDLDHFKDVNDTLGHTVGDRLLQVVGERLTSIVRKSDTVARMGGDEFMLLSLFPGIKREEDAAMIAQRILEVFRKTFAFDDHEIRITTSIGIAIYPDDGNDADTLIKNADVAMYRAKARGRDNYQRYSVEGRGR
jgi:diguanylate cyclase (GGDEF)-like protein/PAS domain S-box-containing protein